MWWYDDARARGRKNTKLPRATRKERREATQSAVYRRRWTKWRLSEPPKWRIFSWIRWRMDEPKED